MNDKLTILLIEDNPGDARLIREMLGETKGAPFELVHADRLAAGLARLAAGGFNVILLDLSLPDSNGPDTLIRVHTHAADAPIVVLTGLDDEALGIRLMHEGAQDYLVKGQIDGNLLVRAIRYAIERKQIERRLLHLAEVLRAVRNVNQLITHERDPQRLLTDACNLLVHTRGYRMTWIGLIEEGHSRVIPAARAGQGTDYLDQVTITWDESKARQGPTGTAIRTRRPVLCADVTTDPRFASWRETVLRYGFASFAAAPMLCGERLFGAVNIYADKPNAFDDEEINLLAELAGDLGFALQSIEDESKRGRAEEAVKQAEERYRNLFEEAPSMYVLTRREEGGPVIADCNQAFLSTLGYTRGEVLARPLADFYSPASQAELLAGGYQRALEGYFQTEERQLVAHDGRVIEAMLQARPELDIQGRVVGTRAMFVDITERKQAQEALTQERNLLRTLIDNLPDAIYVKDAAARKVLVNRADLANIAKQEADVLGKTDWELFPADVAAGFFADDQAVLQSGQAVLDREELLVNVSGQSRWLLTSKLPLRNSGGRVTGLVGIGRDVTELVQTQEALRHSARRLALLHAIDQATLAMQPVETIADAALRGLRQLAPCQRASVMLFDLTAGEGRMLAVQGDGETGLDTGQRIPTEAHLIATLRRGEARVVTDLLSLSPLPPALQILQAEGLRSFVNAPLLVDGELIGMLNLVWERPGACSPEQIEIAREIADQLAIAIQQAHLREQVARHTAELEQRVADRTAELRAANDKLKELDRFKSSFVSDVSHELRQPLTNIKSYLYLLDHGKPEKRAGYMATLHRETDLLQQLIEDLLHLSRIDLGKAQPVLEPLDINRLVGTLAEDRAPLVVEHGLTLQTALTPDLPPVMADTKMVTQVLTNLLANAMNYTPAGGTIVVSTAARQDGGGAGELGSGGAGARGSRGDTQHAIRNTPTEWVTFSVSDTGPGIAAEEQARIFERFYRGEAAHRSRAPGTGLGLPICQELVGRLDGRIMVESQVGQGSTFTVWLPVAKDEGRMTNDEGRMTKDG